MTTVSLARGLIAATTGYLVVDDADGYVVLSTAGAHRVAWVDSAQAPICYGCTPAGQLSCGHLGAVLAVRKAEGFP